MLIICPNCNREVSNTASKCIHCGCCIKKNNYKKQIIVSLLLVALCALLGLGYFCVVKPKIQLKKENIYKQNIYTEAMENVMTGNYNDAIPLLESIRGFSDTDIILDYATWEKYVIEGLFDYRKQMKNPDSLSVYETYLFLSEETAKDTQKLCYTNENDSLLYPAIAVKTGGTNTYGAMVSSYILLMYDSKEGHYLCVGNCEALDKNIYKDTSSFLYDASGAYIQQLILKYQKENSSVGKVDIDRINQILSNTKINKLL